jgi:hypothetical protein
VPRNIILVHHILCLFLSNETLDASLPTAWLDLGSEVDNSMPIFFLNPNLDVGLENSGIVYPNFQFFSKYLFFIIIIRIII